MLRNRPSFALPLSSVLLATFAAAQAPAAPAAPASQSAPAPIDPALAQKIAAEGIERSQAMRILRDLTGKVGHRLTGSDNFTQGCEWAKAEFAAMGLEVELDRGLGDGR